MRATVSTVLRSTAAPWAALVSGFAVQCYNLLSRGAPWTGEYYWSALWVESGLFIPLVVTAVAIGVDGCHTIAPRRRNLATSDDLRGRFMGSYAALLACGTALPPLVALGVTTAWWPRLVGTLQALSLAHLLVAVGSVLSILVVCLALSQVLSYASIALSPLLALWLGFLAMDQGGALAIGNSTGSMVGFGPDRTALGIQAAAAVTLLVAGWFAILALEPGMGRPELARARGVRRRAADLRLCRRRIARIRSAERRPRHVPGRRTWRLHRVHQRGTQPLSGAAQRDVRILPRDVEGARGPERGTGDSGRGLHAV